jgi:hypothetical protein
MISRVSTLWKLILVSGEGTLMILRFALLCELVSQLVPAKSEILLSWSFRIRQFGIPCDFFAAGSLIRGYFAPETGNHPHYHHQNPSSKESRSGRFPNIPVAHVARPKKSI